MKKLVIFGMFVAVMIITPADAFFGRKENKEVELSKSNANILLNGIRGEGKLHDIGLAENGSKRGAAVLVIDNAIAGHMTAFLFGELSKKLLLTIPKAVSFGISSSSVKTVLRAINLASNANEAREILSNWLERNGIKVRIGKLGKKGKVIYILSCHHLSQNQGEVVATFLSKETLEISTTQTGSVGGMHLRPYIEGGKLPCFKITIKGRGKIEQTWSGGERYTWEKTIEGPKIEFPEDASWCEDLPILPLPEWKEIPIEDGLATALVIDKSGSMSGENIRRAQQAARVYVDTCPEGEDMISLAAFSSSAESITEPVSITEGRERLKGSIFSLSAGGSTNVGSGLDVAFNHLSFCNLKDKRAVLMSDGRHNTGTYKPEVAKFQNKGWPIDTVAFGGDADQEMLSWIANQTGGHFLPLNVANIGSGYHKINVMAHNGSVYRSYNDFIRTGDKLAYNIPVEPDMKKVGFFTNWQGSRMETVLFSPNKTVINRSNISNWGRFIEGETHNCYEIDNPQCGTWQALITGYNLPPQGEQVNFHSFCQSDIFSNILGFQPRYSHNQEVRVGVRLAEVVNGRLSPLRGAQITAEIKKPSTSLNKFASDIKRKRLQPTTLLEIFRGIPGFARKITLFDDGLHQDVMPGDGIYANTYNETTINGPYLVTIDCQGYTSQGMSMKRTLQESFQVGPIEQNSFTISDFLGLISKQGTSGQIQKQKTEKIKEKAVEKIIDSVFDKLFKK